MTDRRFLTFSRPLLLLCTGILLATVATALICQHLIVEDLQNRSAQYGRALADLAARQAIDATLNHDLVSLQVILSDVAENADVAKASIHDVENNLLVQAGRSGSVPTGDPLLQTFTAPITLHNSIAGSVAVTLDLSGMARLRVQLYWLFGFMAALLLALTLSALYFGRSWGLPLSIPRPSIPIVDSPPKPEADASSTLAPRAFPRVELIVHLHNLRDLARQLDHQAFRQISRRLEEQLRGVLALYSGQLLQLDSSQARIAFANPELEPDSAFQAICSASLLMTLNRQKSEFPLQMSALIVRRDSDSAILKNLQYQIAESDEYNELLRQASNGSLMMESRLLDRPELPAKISARAIDDFEDLVEIRALGEQYEQLLDRQLEQLKRAQT